MRSHSWILPLFLAASLTTAASATNQLTLTSAQGAPGHVAILVIRSDSLANVGRIDAFLSMPDPSLLGLAEPTHASLPPLNVDRVDVGPSGLDGWSGQDQDPVTGQKALRITAGQLSDSGYTFDQPEAVGYVVFRIARNVPPGTSFPITLNYRVLSDPAGAVIASGSAASTIQVTATPPSPDPASPVAVRLGHYRVAPGQRLRLYTQAGPGFTGDWIYFSEIIPQPLITPDPLLYAPRAWSPGPPGRTYLGHGGGESRFGNPLLNGDSDTSNFYSVDFRQDPRPLEPVPVLTRRYTQVPDDALPGTVYPLPVEAYAIPRPFDRVRPLNAQAGSITVDPAAPFLLGDVNGDGKVTVDDAVLALRIALGLQTLTPDQRDETLQTADVAPHDTCDPGPCEFGLNLASRGDGQITVADGVDILRLALGLPLEAAAAPQ